MGKKYQKKPVVVEAIQYTGDNLEEVQEFATVEKPSFFQEIAEEDRSDDPEQIAEVWDKLHGTWVGVYLNDWIIKGIKGEFYPCNSEVFSETYEEVK